MELLQKIGMGAFALASLLVGLRLLRLAWRTRALPETALGSALLVGNLGFGLLGAAPAVPGRETLLQAWGLAAVGLASCCLWMFTWWVFHRNGRWGLLIAAGGCAAALGGHAMLMATHGLEPGFMATVWFPVSFAGRSLPYVWAAWESLRYYDALRRRARLGLSDPAVVATFLHWGIASSCVAGIWAVALWNVLSGVELGAVKDPLSATLVSLLGVAASVTLARAFFARPGASAPAPAAAP